MYGVCPNAGKSNATYGVCQHAGKFYAMCDLSFHITISPYAGKSYATYEVCPYAGKSYATWDLTITGWYLHINLNHNIASDNPPI
ncbi:unnamed protein product [Prunus armeniaca]